ncbi:MAG: 50S ribosomal protein L23 [Clostridia bacterium]|nr:50S ribosomal protein L23 [Clostridia bacterium]MDY2714672.1 50S ribosomal protein L23 [Christensenellaceae bacterium]MDY3725054.1 50S ribosomal protein L23 [Christensenellaceae bacterium]
MERDIIIKPLLSEKSYATIKDKKYTFVVAKDANKIEIANEIEKRFDVQVAKVNTANYHGKLKRMGRSQGYASDWKKAIVTLKKDSKSIQFFDSLQ